MGELGPGVQGLAALGRIHTARNMHNVQGVGQDEQRELVASLVCTGMGFRRENHY